MAPPVSFFLEPCDDGRGYQFRSLEALRILLNLEPPYRTCLAYAPYARNAPHCSRPVNKKNAAFVPGLLHRLLRVRIPSTTAGSLLKDLSTFAVCGITGWHQDKAAEVQSQWLRSIWGEYLRVHGLEPRLWRGKIPSMTTHGWESYLEIARLQQGYDSEDDDDGYYSDSGESIESDGDDYDDDDDDDGDSDEGEDDGEDDDDDNDDDDDEDDEIEDDDFDHEHGHDYDNDSQSLLSAAVQSPDATTSNSGEFQDSSGLDDTDSWSSEGVATPDTSISDPDENLAEEADLTTDMTTDFDQTSTDGHPPEPEEQNEGGTDEDSIADDLLAIGSDIFGDSDDIGTPFSMGGISTGQHLGFRLYPQAPSPVSQLMQLLNLMTQTVSHRRRYAGYIYGFARPSLPGFLKIGVVKDTVIPRRLHPDPVDHRLATWQVQCGHPIVEVFRKRIICDAAERIESLVHLALRKYRRVEDPPCRRCERRKRAARARDGGQRGGGMHDEWFEVDTQTAMRVVDLFAAFSDRRPYDRFGKLVDFWSNKAEEKKRDVGPGDTIDGWLQTMPRLAEEQTRVELDEVIGRFYSLG